MKVALANSQVFQSLYIDTDAKESKDKIVLIEEMVDSLPEAQGILHSMLKEPYYGMVISGSNIGVAKFRAKMYELDHDTNLGKEDIAEILTQIAKLAYSLKCEVVHFKGPIVYDSIPENMSVALDLKKLFDPSKIKEGGKEFWNNLIGVDKNLEKEFLKIDLKEHNKLVDYLDKNEKSITDLKEAIRKQGIKTPNLDNMLEEMEVNEYEEYLGPTYSNLKYYYIDLGKFKDIQKIKEEPPIPPAPASPPAPDEKRVDRPKAVNNNDPRVILRSYILNVKNSNKRIMDAKNLVDIGINSDHMLLALKQPESFDVGWWPNSPIKGTVQLLESFDWAKNPDDNSNKNKKWSRM